MDILINNKTKNQFDNFLSNPSHALMLVAPSGMGKFFVAQWLARKLLKTQNNQDPRILIVEPEDKNSIIIDQVRQIKDYLAYTKSSSADLQKIVIINNSELLTVDAQNSLLKILEEPPKQVLIILTTTNAQILLPTINSRSQRIDLIGPTRVQVKEYFNKIPDNDFLKFWLASDGRPALLYSLVNNENNELLDQITEAKLFFSKTNYEKIIYLSSKNKNDLLKFLQAASVVGKSAFAISIKNNRERPQLNNWHKVNKAIDQAKELLDNNVNIKLISTKFVLDL